MKKLIALLLAFCLPAAALAETVAEQVRAPERVVEMLTSSTGGTVIRIDAPVTVPGAETMYRIPVTAAIFEDEMAVRLAELMWPGIDEPLEVTDDDNGYYHHHSATVFRRGTRKEDIRIETHASYDLLHRPEGVYGGVLTGSITLGMDASTNHQASYNNPYMATEVAGEGIEGHPLTRAEAETIATEFLRGVTEEPFELFAVGQRPGTVINGKSPSGSGAPSYVFAFTRNLDGVPLLPCMHGFMNTSHRDDLFIPPVSYEEIVMSMDREGRITGFMWHAPYAYGDDRAPETLLPFDTILAVARRILPLKYQGWESLGPVSFEVYRIDLGYMAVLERDRQTFALTPVWNFYGYPTDDEDGHIGCLPILTVNAADGTVIDRDLGY